MSGKPLDRNFFFKNMSLVVLRVMFRRLVQHILLNFVEQHKIDKKLYIKNLTEFNVDHSHLIDNLKPNKLENDYTIIFYHFNSWLEF